MLASIVANIYHPLAAQTGSSQMRLSLLLSLVLVAAAPAACRPAAQPAPQPKFDVARLSRDIQTLAGDEFEGRGPATAGEARARRLL